MPMLAISMFVAATAATTTATPGPSPREWFASVMVDEHNVYRSRAGVEQMKWDEELARGAEAYAQQLARLGDIEHSPPEARVGQGENLWMGTRAAFTPERMVGDWAAEVKMYRAGAFPAVSSSGSWHDVGHYTQIIWPETTSVGCGVSRSADWDFLVCRYSPAGNVMGRPLP